MKLFGKWQSKEKEEQPVRQVPTFDSDGMPAPDASIGQNRKILVVDDDLVVLKAFQLKLGAQGFNVLTATDGATAVGVAREVSPDLIVLDINFPPDVGSSGMQWDGFNTMQWMQRFRELGEIPVIIITAGDPEEFKQRALAAGAVAFFQKPINHEEFLMAIRRAMGQPQSKAKTA
jgi:CheY-like chemotaxis protein